MRQAHLKESPKKGKRKSVVAGRRKSEFASNKSRGKFASNCGASDGDEDQAAGTPDEDAEAAGESSRKQESPDADIANSSLTMVEDSSPVPPASPSPVPDSSASMAGAKKAKMKDGDNRAFCLTPFPICP